MDMPMNSPFTHKVSSHPLQSSLQLYCMLHEVNEAFVQYELLICINDDFFSLL